MKNRQGITIAALIVAIIGLSIGFAAFSNTLTISSSASVNPSDENFKVVFAKNTNVQNLDTTDVTPTKSPNNVTGFTAEDAEINNEALAGPTLTNLKANFTAPGQSVTYTLNVVNAGKYIAYLKDLVFANAEHATSGETYKHCYAATKDSNNQDIAPANQATGTLVTQACNGISISVSIGTSTNLTYSATPISLGNQALSANGGNVQAIITISYDSNAAYVDGPMEVEFGDISFTASSNPAVQQQEQGGQGGESEEPQESPVTGTYNVFMGSDLDQIVLADDGSATASAGGQSMPTTYTYDSTNNTVTIDMGAPVTLNYAENDGNKVLYGTLSRLNIFTTNGSTGFAPISGTYTGTHDNKEASFTFNTSGQLTGLDEDLVTSYIVINNTVYTNKAAIYFTTNDNYATLNSYYYDESESIFTLQS